MTTPNILPKPSIEDAKKTSRRFISYLALARALSLAGANAINSPFATRELRSPIRSTITAADRLIYLFKKHFERPYLERLSANLQTAAAPTVAEFDDKSVDRGAALLEVAETLSYIDTDSTERYAALLFELNQEIRRRADAGQPTTIYPEKIKQLFTPSNH